LLTKCIYFVVEDRYPGKQNNDFDYERGDNRNQPVHHLGVCG